MPLLYQNIWKTVAKVTYSIITNKLEIDGDNFT